MDGWISTFWEQGMEEYPWLIFQDETFTEGESWLREGMHQLQAGDHLTIFAPDGDVLWQGELRPRRQGWFGRSTLVPPEVGEGQWDSWFYLKPSLRARLKPRTSESNC